MNQTAASGTRSTSVRDEVRGLHSSLEWALLLKSGLWRIGRAGRTGALCRHLPARCARSRIPAGLPPAFPNVGAESLWGSFSFPECRSRISAGLAPAFLNVGAESLRSSLQLSQLSRTLSSALAVSIVSRCPPAAPPARLRCPFRVLRG